MNHRYNNVHFLYECHHHLFGLPMENKLTLAVPTFNRRDAIVENTRQILRGIRSLPVDYLVIDNASDDGTYDALVAEFGENNQARFLKNSSNIGYFGNFLELFENCSTEYIIISSDEDEFIVENINKLIEFIDGVDPVMVSCQVYLGKKGELYKGKSKRAPIAPKDYYRSSHYISGLVFNIKKLKSTIELMKGAGENKMVNIYPQVILTVSAIALNEAAIWYDCPLTDKKYNLNSNIFDREGDRYFKLESRVKQLRDFHKILHVVRNLENHDSVRIECIREESLSSFFSVIRHALSKENDQDILNYFDKASKRFVLGSLVRQPLSFLRNAKLRFLDKIGKIL